MPNAFKARAFENLYELGFVNNTRMELKTDALAHLTRLHYISFLNTNLVPFKSDFLTPLHKRLRRLFYNELPSTIDIGQVFGDRKLGALQVVELQGNRSDKELSRTISSKDFSQLRAIKFLGIFFCGIETILTGTFDFISETLTGLNLSFNKIKTIDINLFWDFFDRPGLGDRVLWIENNDFICDCRFYELNNFTKLFDLVREKPEENYIRLITCIPLTYSVTCDRLQSISMKRINAESDLKYSLPKVILRVRDRNLIIKSESVPKLRLIAIQPESMDTRKRSRCPRVEWLQSSVSCTILNAKLNPFAMIELRELSALTLFCVILPMTHRRAWPLHCQTIQFASETKMDHSSIACVLLVVDLMGFMIALGSAIVYFRDNTIEAEELETRPSTRK